ncbi:MAG: hypothetical protein ACQETP_11945, partial [Bacteroidota bacterium]
GLWTYGLPLLWGDSSAGLTSDLTWAEVGSAVVAGLVVLAGVARHLWAAMRPTSSSHIPQASMEHKAG